MFFCEFWEMFKKSFLTEQLRVTTTRNGLKAKQFMIASFYSYPSFSFLTISEESVSFYWISHIFAN